MLAFIVFITVRGELPVYMGLLLADPSGGGAVPAPARAASSAPSAADAAKLAANLLPMLA